MTPHPDSIDGTCSNSSSEDDHHGFIKLEELKKQHEVNIDCINSDILKINAKLPFWCNGERSMKMLKFDFIKESDQYKLQSLLFDNIDITDNYRPCEKCHCTIFPWLLSKLYWSIMKDHVQSRDFQYPVHDSRHWGYSLSGREPKRSCDYDARAIYTYMANDDEELSFKQDELLHIYKNLGNGWLMARKTEFINMATNNSSSNEEDKEKENGRVPESYFDRV